MKALTLTLLVSTFVSPVFAGPEATYVGLDRYACSGRGSECTQVDMNNRIVSETQRRHYQEEQDRAQAYDERNRREERERLKNLNQKPSDTYR